MGFAIHARARARSPAVMMRARGPTFGTGGGATGAVPRSAACCFVSFAFTTSPKLLHGFFDTRSICRERRPSVRSRPLRLSTVLRVHSASAVSTSTAAGVAAAAGTGAAAGASAVTSLNPWPSFTIVPASIRRSMDACTVASGSSDPLFSGSPRLLKSRARGRRFLNMPSTLGICLSR